MPPRVPCPRIRHENVKDTCFLRVLGQDTAISVSDTAKKRVPISARRVPKTGHGFHVFFSRLVYKMIFSLDFYHLFCLVWGLEWFVQEEKEGFHCPSHCKQIQGGFQLDAWRVQVIRSMVPCSDFFPPPRSLRTTSSPTVSLVCASLHCCKLANVYFTVI